MPSFYDDFRRDVETTVAEADAMIPQECRDWLLRCLDHNVRGGKQTRAKTFLLAAHHLLPNSGPPADVKRSVLGLAWCLELLQAFFLVADDIMDGAERRRGQPCWHRMVGLTALNDSMLLQTTMFMLLARYASSFHGTDTPFRIQMLFQETILRTECGQHLDMQSDRKAHLLGTMQRWEEIATLKTAHYSFLLPISLALLLFAPCTALALRARAVALRMGRLFQCQDDYLDVFGDVERLGKVGTDCAEGKCSWLACRAYQTLEAKDDAKGMQVLTANYGKSDPEAIAAVKRLFSDLCLPRQYEEYEAEEARALRADIAESFPSGSDDSTAAALRAVFIFLCDKTFGRKH